MSRGLAIKAGRNRALVSIHAHPNFVGWSYLFYHRACCALTSSAAPSILVRVHPFEAIAGVALVVTESALAPSDGGEGWPIAGGLLGLHAGVVLSAIFLRYCVDGDERD